ncbi:unnamed protein product [Lupinus luteus]|uniref:Putative plant transposon protein domain-containing protein n=1 Tax=Lupinus luteus TaxID=3873 RepID=A0AAV1WXF8_LUPLU
MWRTKHTGKKDPPPPKRTRTGASSSQPAAQFDRTKFRNKGKEDRYIILLNWLFFDPEVVREFYANAYLVDEDGEELAYRSWVRGKVILFDRDTIHALLHEPSGPADYDWINEVSTRFDDSTITRKQILRLLCIPGTSFSTNSDGQPLRLYRKHMTQLAQLWMMFLVHNVIPNSHVSSLPLPDCYLLYALMSGMKVDVAAIIARDIYKNVVRAWKKEERTPPQNPESHPPPPTTASVHPPSLVLPHSEPTPSSSIEDQLRHLSLQNDHLARQNEHLGLQNEMLRQGQSLNVEKKKKKKEKIGSQKHGCYCQNVAQARDLAQAPCSRPSEGARIQFLKKGRTKHTGKKDPPPPKRTRTGASSSQPAAQFDRTKFRNKGKEDRYIILLNWLFVPERQVLLEDGEIPLFTDVLDALNWWILASPADKFDPEMANNHNYLLN